MLGHAGLSELFRGILDHSKNKTHRFGDNAVPALGVKSKWGLYVFCLLFKIGLRSAIPFKRSRRELATDVAEHNSMLKNYQNTLYPVLVSFPKQV